MPSNRSSELRTLHSQPAAHLRTDPPGLITQVHIYTFIHVRIRKILSLKKCISVHTIYYVKNNTLKLSTDVCEEHSVSVSEAHVLGSSEIVCPKHEQLLPINTSSIVTGRMIVCNN